MTPALQVEDVSVVLGGRTVLRDVNLQVKPGEVLGIVGPNGAGKTTLLRTVMGLQRPRTGRVLVDGSTTQRRVGYVPQRHEFVWDFPMSVGHVVLTGLGSQLGLWRRAGIPHWRAVRAALDRVGLTEFVDRPVGQLSGGQRQRVLIARALAADPPLLLLDEPFTGLDLPTQDALTELFSQLAGQGTAIVTTTHDIASALFSCDKLALIAGTVMAHDAPHVLAADHAVWCKTFGVGPGSGLLRLLTAA